MITGASDPWRGGWLAICLAWVSVGDFMQAPQRAARRVMRFGVFEVDLHARELRKRGIRIGLQQQPLRVLALLLEHAGELVTREDLRQAIWPAGTFVEFDVGLDAAIHRLRAALDDSAESPRFVETLPRRGYRFIAAVDGVAQPLEESPPKRKVLVWAGGLAVAAALLLALDHGGLHDRLRGRPPSATPPSIAVLPLTNLGTDASDASLADGMTEELIGILARLGQVRVIASTSVFGFKGRPIDVRRIADSLRVSHILEGGFRRVGSRLRLQVRLVDARDGSTRWAATYDREMKDVFATQDELAGAVARELEVRLEGRTGSNLLRHRTRNIEAYELYLRGHDLTLHFTDSGLRAGLEYFNQAIALDSTFAAAYAARARGYAPPMCWQRPGWDSRPIPSRLPRSPWLRGRSIATVAATRRSRSSSRSRDSGRRYAGPCSPPAYASQNRGGGPRPSRRCARGERPAVCTGARCSGSCWRSRGSGRKPVRFLQSCSRDSSAAATWPRMLPSCTPDWATSTGPSPGLTGRRTRVRRSPQPPCSRKSWGPRFGTCAAIRGSSECASVWDCRADSAL